MERRAERPCSGVATPTACARQFGGRHRQRCPRPRRTHPGRCAQQVRRAARSRTGCSRCRLGSPDSRNPQDPRIPGHTRFRSQAAVGHLPHSDRNRHAASNREPPKATEGPAMPIRSPAAAGPGCPVQDVWAWVRVGRRSGRVRARVNGPRRPPGVRRAGGSPGAAWPGRRSSAAARPRCRTRVAACGAPSSAPATA